MVLFIVRNGQLLATKRHKVHKKFESASQQIIRFVAFVIFVARNNRKLVDVAQESYSFPGSAWERTGVEAPASLVHKRRMHFGDAEPRLHSSYQAEPQSLVTRLHSATKLAIRATRAVAIKTR